MVELYLEAGRLSHTRRYFDIYLLTKKKNEITVLIRVVCPFFLCVDEEWIYQLHAPQNRVCDVQSFVTVVETLLGSSI